MTDAAGNDYIIEPMSIGDFDEVTRLWLGTDGIGVSESDSRPAIAQYLERNPGLSLVVRWCGGIVATVLCGYDGRRGYLYHLSVAEAHRKKGLARELVNRCLVRLQELGILRCNILVFTDNTDGAGFWEREGWTKRSNVQLFQKMLASPAGGGCSC